MKQQLAPAQGWAWHPRLGNARLVLPPSLSSASQRDRRKREGRPEEKGYLLPHTPGLRGPPRKLQMGLTSWRMSSSLGMMESSRASSLQRQGRGSGPAEATGSGRTGILVARAPPGPRGWGCRDSVRRQNYYGRREAGGTHLFWIRAMTWE